MAVAMATSLSFLDATIHCSCAELPKTVLLSISNGDFQGMGESLPELIKKKSEGKTVSEIYKDDELMHLIVVADLLKITGSKNIGDWVEKDKKYRLFLKTFLNNKSWVESYLGAGLVPQKNTVGLRVLGDIWMAYRKEPDFKKYLNLATGIACAWGAGNYADGLQAAEKSNDKGRRCDPVWRYNFFKESHKANKLLKGFENLQPWEIRFVAGGIWDDASLEYLQGLVNIPPHKYGDACWRAEYCGTSEFGDSIQGPLFYVAWGNDMGQAQKTVEHGGVCGALSHVGATAAAARGIPAYPVGQPGHCAYGFRIKRGEWVGGFGGPHGGPHNSIFPGEAPTSTNLMEAAFADDKKVMIAHKAASLARVMEEIGNLEFAKEAWSQSLRATPLNMVLQQNFQKFALANNLYTSEEWYKYAGNLLEAYKGHGFAALSTLSPVTEKFLGVADDARKLEWFAMVQESLALTPTSWAIDISPVLKDQLAALDNIKSGEIFLKNVLRTHLTLGDGTNFGKVLEWGMSSFVDSGNAATFSQAFSESVVSPEVGIMKDGASSEEKDKKMREAFSKAIIAAEQARSASAVLAITAAAKAYQKKNYDTIALDSLICPEGELVSDKGYLRLSTTSNWDSPCDHLNVLTKGGGAFHTDAEPTPYVIVELAAPANMTGLLLVKNNGNEWRMKKMKVSRSTDGATWFEVAKTDDMPKQWRIDTPDNPSAKWLKVESITPEKEVLHLSHILVFEKKN